MDYIDIVDKVGAERRKSLDHISKEIRRLEGVLKKGGFPTFHFDLNYCFLAWKNNRLYYQDAEIERPLIETKAEVRVKMYPYLQEFCEAIIKETQ